MNIGYRVLSVILAILACFGILLIYGTIGHYLGWRAGGGAIPTMILLAGIFYASKSIWQWGGRKLP